MAGDWCNRVKAHPRSEEGPGSVSGPVYLHTKDAGVVDGTWLSVVMGQRYNGRIKKLSGAFGFLSCPKVAEMYNGADVFLHRREYDGSCFPRPGDEVSFRLEFDKYGAPVAKDVKHERDPLEKLS